MHTQHSLALGSSVIATESKCRNQHSADMQYPVHRCMKDKSTCRVIQQPKSFKRVSLSEMYALCMVVRRGVAAG